MVHWSLHCEIVNPLPAELQQSPDLSGAGMSEVSRQVCLEQAQIKQGNSELKLWFSFIFEEYKA